MDAFFDWFKRIFFTMFRFSGQRYKRRFMAGIRARTLGKAQARALKARTNMDKKVFNAQDKLLGDGKKKKKKKK